MNKQFSDWWAIILGGSSGFGFASVEKLAAHGMNIAVLYRETSAAERILKEKFAAIAASTNVMIDTYNLNALDTASRDSFFSQFAVRTGKKHTVRLFLHSIARGNLKPLMAEDDLSVEDIRFTTYAMATSHARLGKITPEGRTFLLRRKDHRPYQ
jgi:enoyl-[acyl-carrier protein] reductase III